MRRRRDVSAPLEMPLTSSPNTETRPRLGRAESRIRRSSVVLPAPDGPVRNWNECGAMVKLMSLRTSGPTP